MALNKGLILAFLFPSICLADPILDDPCASLLAVIDRPTGSDSPCAVKPGQVIVELGYQYQKLYPVHGNSNDFPEVEVRFGLPFQNEIAVLVPNYINARTSDEGQATGPTATVAGIKHQFPNFDKWTSAAEILFTLPTGGSNFGSNALGVAINAIINYAVTPSISAAAMLGVTSETVSLNQGGKRFTSFNPDVTVSWQTTENFQFYVEVYGQTKAGPDLGNGYNADGGIQYLLTKNIELDAEYGVRISGQLGGFSQYFGVGGGIRF